MATVCGYRDQFYISYVTYVLVFPFVLTGFTLLFMRPGTVVGFSGVLMAFYRYLPLVMGGFIAEQFGLDTTTNVAPLLYFIGLGIIVLLSVWPALTNPTVALGSLGLLLVVLLTLLWYAATILSDDNDPRGTVQRAWQKTGYFELSVTAFVLLVTFPFAMFPLEPTIASGIVDTYTHLLAYSLGFVTTFILTVLIDTKAENQAITRN